MHEGTQTKFRPSAGFFPTLTSLKKNVNLHKKFCTIRGLIIDSPHLRILIIGF